MQIRKNVKNKKHFINFNPRIDKVPFRADVGNGYLMLVSQEGVIMVHPNEAFALSKDNSVSIEDAADGNYKNLIYKPNESHIIRDYAGGAKMAIAEQSGVSGWYLAMFKPLLSVYMVILVLAALILVLGIAACFLFSKYNGKLCRNWFAPIENVSGIVPKLAAGATEQAAAASKLSENMEELDQQLLSVMGSMDAAIQYVDQTGEQLMDGGKKMKELETAMQIIEDTTNKIDEIMVFIEEIAKQTNLLSLNASIEAARTGEAGKGFAVVADEINSLSLSCAQASSKTSQLVQESKKAVETGRKLSLDTAKQLQDGIRSAQTSSESVAQMKEVLKVQQEKVATINTLANEIVGVVESNAASAQENAASGADLIQCAQEMKDSVKRFTLRQLEN